jgi:hypothetical protein
MKRVSFCLLFLFFFLSSVLGIDTISQKIAVTLDKNSGNYSVDLILQKALLSESLGTKDIILYSGQKEDLETLGIEKINGGILLKTARNTDTYTVELYSIDKEPLLLNQSIKFRAENFAANIDDIAKRILKAILSLYPPKQKDELKTIETVKIKLSEFEPIQPAWNIYLMPGFGMQNISMRLSDSNGSSSDQNNFEDNKATYFLASEFFLRIHQWNFNLGVSGGIPLGNFSANVGAGFGFFGSVIVLGIEGAFFHGRFLSQAQNSFVINSITNQVNFPDVSYNIFCLGSRIQINITKNYYILFSVGGFLWNKANLDFKSPDFQSADIYFNESSGPYMKFLLNWGLAKKLRLNVFYTYYSLIFQSNYAYNKIAPIQIKSDGTSIKGFTIKEFRLGLGLEYEF